MNRGNEFITALISIIFGIILVIFQGNIINWILTGFGICLLITAIIELVRKNFGSAIIKAIIGTVVMVFGWAFINVALIILAIVIIFRGITQIFAISKYYSDVYLPFSQKVILFSRPLLSCIAGVFLLFNQSGTISWAFIITGVLLVIEGIFDIIELCNNK